MCGIVGLIGDWPDGLLRRLNQSQLHRGPDDDGAFEDKSRGVQLAMRRLSIIDLADGQQPMCNEDSSVWIVFNGEIFNAPELRESLETRGHRFKTDHSDTEVLLHLYEEKGEDMFAELNGMFAFVLFDVEQGKLFGARDRFGIKPFYYHFRGGRLAFASEMKTLLKVPGLSRDVNLQSLYHYLSLRFVPGEGSILRDIERLPPAHSFSYDLQSCNMEIGRYWQPEFASREEHPVEEWCEIIRQELANAVSRWTRSDVPVGCSLSGGIDSSAMVALLSESGCGKVKTYSLGFQSESEGDWDERELAREVAEHYETDHHELSISPDDLLNDLVQMVWHLDEPYGGGLPNWYVFKAMSQDVKVGLTGSGGDELFGGYGKWQTYERRSQGADEGHLHRLKDAAKRLGLHVPAGWVGADRQDAWKTYLRPIRQPFDAYSLYFNDDVKRSSCVAFDVSDMTATADYLQQLSQFVETDNVRDRFTSVDLQTQLPEEFMLMEDRFSMAHSLEARIPFLDAQFTDRILGIPAGVRTRDSDLKYLLKRSVKDLLPPRLFKARKRGFVIPDTIWLRGKLRPLVERFLNPSFLKSQGLLNPGLYAQVVAPHLSGKRDFTGQVWTLLMFQLWYVMYVEQSASECPSYSWQDMS